MGACGVSGEFISYNWEKGIKEVQESAACIYGSGDGYSGAENCCSFRYYGDKSALNKKELEKFIDSRMDEVEKRSGEVLKIGTEGFDIFKTVIEPFTLRLTSEDIRFLFKGVKSPAVLISVSSYLSRRAMTLKSGTLADLKKEANRLMRESFYSDSYIVLSKNASYICKGEKTTVKKTTRTTNSNVLVLPLYKFVYYGIAPC